MKAPKPFETSIRMDPGVDGVFRMWRQARAEQEMFCGVDYGAGDPLSVLTFVKDSEHVHFVIDPWQEELLDRWLGERRRPSLELVNDGRVWRLPAGALVPRPPLDPR
jgi:hypothetical protein